MSNFTQNQYYKTLTDERLADGMKRLGVTDSNYSVKVPYQALVAASVAGLQSDGSYVAATANPEALVTVVGSGTSSFTIVSTTNDYLQSAKTGSDKYAKTVTFTAAADAITSSTNIAGNSIDGSVNTLNWTATSGTAPVKALYINHVNASPKSGSTADPFSLNLANFDSKLKTVAFNSSAAYPYAVTVDNLPSGAVLESVSLTKVSGGTSKDVLVNMSNVSTTYGTSDLKINLSGCDFNNLNFAPANNAANSGYTSATINSTGNNTINQLEGGAAHNKLFVNSTGTFTVKDGSTLNIAATTIDASQSAGNVLLGTVTALPSTVVKVTGGKGDDFVNVAGANPQTTVSIDGGAGKNTVMIDTSAYANAASAITTFKANVKNYQVFGVQGANGLTIDADTFGVKEVHLNATGGANTVNFNDWSNSILTLYGARGGHTTISQKTPDSSKNFTAKLVLDTSTGANNILGNVSNATVKNLNIHTKNGASTMSALTLDAAAAVTVTGDQSLTISGVFTGASIDGSSMTGPLIITGTPAQATTIKLPGVATSVATGSTAADTIETNGAAVTVTGAAGIDTIKINTPSAVTITMPTASANRDLVTGFTVGTSSVPILKIGAACDTTNCNKDISTTFTKTSAGDILEVTAQGNVDLSTTKSVLHINRVSSTLVADVNSPTANELNGTTLLAALGGTITITQDKKAVIIARDASNTYIYAGDEDNTNTALAAAEISLIAILQGVTSAIDYSQLTY